MTSREYIPGFDILKFVMAIVIVSLHAEMTSVMTHEASIIVANFQALAVPVFFVLSSYLFWKVEGCSWTEKVLWSFEKRIFILYLIWSLIMLPITFRYHNYFREGALGLLYGWRISFLTIPSWLVGFFAHCLSVYQLSICWGEGLSSLCWFRSSYIIVLHSLILFRTYWGIQSICITSIWGHLREVFYKQSFGYL